MVYRLWSFFRRKEANMAKVKHAWNTRNFSSVLSTLAGLAQLVRALLERLTALDSLSWTKTQGHDITLET